MKILITGGNGQIAYDLKRQAQEKNIHYSAPSREQCDVTDMSAVQTMIHQYQPDFVINTAAYTLVDQSEQEYERALAVNRDGARNLAKACEQAHCPLIHLSTDYVFDGKKNLPYVETDLTVPLNRYGESKLLGEQEILRYSERHIILRVSAVFGEFGNNFVKTILRLAQEKEQLRIVSDQIICPTPAAAIAETVLKICETPRWGLFHYCGNIATNWCEFAGLIVEEALSYEPLAVKHIAAISSDEYQTAAKRPHYSVLSCEKITQTFGIQAADWETGLKHVINSLYAA